MFDLDKIRKTLVGLADDLYDAAESGNWSRAAELSATAQVWAETAQRQVERAR